jgi:hypothetical protein
MTVDKNTRNENPSNPTIPQMQFRDTSKQQLRVMHVPALIPMFRRTGPSFRFDPEISPIVVEPSPSGPLESRKKSFECRKRIWSLPMIHTQERYPLVGFNQKRIIVVHRTGPLNPPSQHGSAQG